MVPQLPAHLKLQPQGCGCSVGTEDKLRRYRKNTERRVREKRNLDRTEREKIRESRERRD